MSFDISHILNSWSYKPGEVNARKISADDGSEKIQLRLDLGILQMEMTGRPDRTRPFGFESLLEYYKDKLSKHSSSDPDTPFALDEYDCEQLRNEGVMYYHRYLACFVLGEYKTVVEDTARNLEMFDLCQQHASCDSDRNVQESARPYVIMMNSRSAAQLELARNQPGCAYQLVQNGIAKIQALYHKFDRDDLLATCPELMTLRSLARDIKAAIPVDPARKLEDSLKAAICQERYEEAARLRDEIRKLKEQ